MRPAVRVLGRVGGYWWGSGATCWAEGTAPPPAVPKSPLPGEGHTKGGHKGLCPLPCSLPRAGHGARRAGGGPRRWHWDGVSPPPAASVTRGCQAGCWQQVAPSHQPGGFGEGLGEPRGGFPAPKFGAAARKARMGASHLQDPGAKVGCCPRPCPAPQNVTSGDPKSHGR